MEQKENALYHVYKEATRKKIIENYVIPLQPLVTNNSMLCTLPMNHAILLHPEYL